MSHCSRGSFYYRLNTRDDTFTCIRTLHAVIELYLFPLHAYSHTQIYISTDSQGLGDRRTRMKRKHSVFGHDYDSLFIPVAAYDKVVHTVPVLLAQSLRLLAFFSAKPPT